jgi:hypothetical protein
LRNHDLAWEIDLFATQLADLTSLILFGDCSTILQLGGVPSAKDDVTAA